MISLSGSGEVLDFTGTPVDPSIPIALNDGWNWIGYLPQGEIETNSALSTVVATTNDQIKTQTAASVYYDGGGWLGSLSSMAPGQGYMLSVAEGSVLVYPSGSDGLSRMVVTLAEEEILPVSISSWAVNPHAYEFSGTIDMSIDSREDFDGDYIGVFVGTECRGIAKRMYFPLDGSYYYSAMVYSNVTEGENLTFKYYSVLDDEIINYGENVEFTANMIVGNGLNTFGLSDETGIFGQPVSYGLSDAYPNPFNPVTTLNYQLPMDSQVSIQVYNVQGRLVKTLADQYMQAGYHSITWSADGHSSGVYFVTMMSDDYVSTQKLLLVK
jgi:hypothetical protein